MIFPVAARMHERASGRLQSNEQRRASYYLAGHMTFRVDVITISRDH